MRAYAIGAARRGIPRLWPLPVVFRWCSRVVPVAGSCARVANPQPCFCWRHQRSVSVQRSSIRLLVVLSVITVCPSHASSRIGFVKLKLDVAMRSREAMSSRWGGDPRQPWLADAGVLCREGRGWRGGWAAQGTDQRRRMLVVRDNAAVVYSTIDWRRGSNNAMNEGICIEICTGYINTQLCLGEKADEGET
jgi:hypothetical protein